MMWPGIVQIGMMAPDAVTRLVTEDLVGYSFQQPYASAIMAVKRDENRPQAVPAARAGRPFWICVHAGITWYAGADDAVWRWRRARPSAGPDYPDFGAWLDAPYDRSLYPQRAILGFARVVGCVDYQAARDLAASPLSDDGIRDRCRRWLEKPSTKAWAFGPYVWRLDDTVLCLPHALPVSKGALGLWKLDGDRRVDLSPTTAWDVRAAFAACLSDRSTWRRAA